jgi:hypothetical protein
MVVGKKGMPAYVRKNIHRKKLDEGSDRCQYWMGFPSLKGVYMTERANQYIEQHGRDYVAYKDKRLRAEHKLRFTRGQNLKRCTKEATNGQFCDAHKNSVFHHTITVYKSISRASKEKDPSKLTPENLVVNPRQIYKAFDLYAKKNSEFASLWNKLRCGKKKNFSVKVTGSTAGDVMRDYYIEARCRCGPPDPRSAIAPSTTGYTESLIDLGPTPTVAELQRQVAKLREGRRKLEEKGGGKYPEPLQEDESSFNPRRNPTEEGTPLLGPSPFETSYMEGRPPV